MPQRSILLYENDNSARRDIVNLIVRDRRTRLEGAAGTKKFLLDALENPACKPDAIVIDLEYRRDPRPIDLITQLHDLRPNIPIICLSAYAAEEAKLICAAIQAGARGFLDKGDVNVMYATAVIQAIETGFVYSHAVEHALHADHAKLISPKHRIETWQLHPRIDPRHINVLHQCILFGLPARVVAAHQNNIQGAQFLTPNSVTTYRNEIYNILRDYEDFYDLTYLFPIWADIAPYDERNQRSRIRLEGAFHILTQPPKNPQENYHPFVKPPQYPIYDTACVNLGWPEPPTPEYSVEQ